MKLATLALIPVISLGYAIPAFAQQSAKPRVHVIATGGTISNMGNDPRRTGAELVAGIPGLADIAEVTTEQFSNGLERGNAGNAARLIEAHSRRVR